jgi:flagellar basal-body rod protein FlgB
MWIDRLTSSRSGRALELATQFAEQRQRVLADNLANVDTPDYQTKRLDRGAFQASLQQALTRAADRGSDGLELRGNAQFTTNSAGQVVSQPAVEPAANALFHDGTNVRMEQLIAETNENSLSYELAMNLLRNRFDGLLRAIRGRLA